MPLADAQKAISQAIQRALDAHGRGDAAAVQVLCEAMIRTSHEEAQMMLRALKWTIGRVAADAQIAGPVLAAALALVRKSAHIDPNDSGVAGVTAEGGESTPRAAAAAAATPTSPTTRAFAANLAAADGPAHTTARLAVDLVVQTVSANPTLAKSAFDAVTRCLVPANSAPTTPAGGPLSISESKAKYHAAALEAAVSAARDLPVYRCIKSLLMVAPTGLRHLFEAVSAQFPPNSRPLDQHVGYTMHLLQLARLIPALEGRVLPIMMERMVAVDAEIDLDLLEREQEEEEERERQQQQLRQQQQQQQALAGGMQQVLAPHFPANGSGGVRTLAEKLDVMVTLTIRYVMRRCGREEVGGAAPTDPRARREARILFELLMAVFEHTVLRMHQCKYTQFVLFYACSLGPAQYECFIGRMLNHVRSEQLSPQLRLVCAGYLGSFLARALYVQPSTVHSALAYLVAWAGAFAKRALTRASAAGAVAADRATLAHHAGPPAELEVFYAVCQAVFYVFCFHSQTFSGDAGSDVLAQLRGLGLDDMLHSKLDPISKCAPHIAKTFVEAAAALQLLDPATVTLPQEEDEGEDGGDAATGGPVDDAARGGGAASRIGDASAAQLRRLRRVFPFEPCELDRTSRLLDPLYRHWGEAGIGVLDVDDGASTETDERDGVQRRTSAGSESLPSVTSGVLPRLPSDGSTAGATTRRRSGHRRRMSMDSFGPERDEEAEDSDEEAEDDEESDEEEELEAMGRHMRGEAQEGPAARRGRPLRARRGSASGRPRRRSASGESRAVAGRKRRRRSVSFAGSLAGEEDDAAEGDGNEEEEEDGDEAEGVEAGARRGSDSRSARAASVGSGTAAGGSVATGSTSFRDSAVEVTGAAAAALMAGIADGMGMELPEEATPAGASVSSAVGFTPAAKRRRRATLGSLTSDALREAVEGGSAMAERIERMDFGAEAFSDFREAVRRRREDLGDGVSDEDPLSDWDDDDQEEAALDEEDMQATLGSAPAQVERTDAMGSVLSALGMQR